MILDPQTLAAAFVLLSAILGMLLLFAWTHNRRVHALAWWGGAFCLIPIGIGMANLGQGVPSHLNLLVANTLVMLAYGALYAGCRAFNGRSERLPAIIIGPVLWIVAFPFIHETLSSRLLFVSLIIGGYASFSGWELWRNASHRLASQRAAVLLLFALAAFNFFRGILGLQLNLNFWLNTFANRWSTEIALFLVVYAPMLAFVFLSMAKERIEADHERTEQALRESEEHYRYSVELNPQIPWTTDSQGNLLDVSPRWCALTGMPVEEALGQGWIRALRADDILTTARQWSDALGSRNPIDVEYRLRLADGSCRWFRARATPRLGGNGTVIRWYGTVEDIHDRKLAEEKLHWAAYHDDLTCLSNRRLFQECLEQALDQAERTGRKVGLLIMDLDHLKQINDRFGHDAGDALLKEFAKRLCSLVRTTDTVARLGGDEFAIILADVASKDEVVATAKAILARMQEPLRHDGKTLDCRTSIGGAISERSTEGENLQKQADLALYRCKAAGRGTFTMFHPAMREEAQKTTSALEVARNAVMFDRIVPFYQPKVALASGALSGFEALLRWHHPRLGVQPPEAIAAAFDDTDLGTAIGERMRFRVFSDIRNWLDAGLDIGRIAINASPAEFRHDDYAERVLEELGRSGVPMHCLEVEVTESVFLGRSAGYVERALRMLSAAGVTIALDDFGTGYASLTHLKRFPSDVIKVDRSFISDLEADAEGAAIVKAVLSLGRSLGIEVVAEGVETLAQASLLWEQGCGLGQGYFFGWPMAAETVQHFVQSWQCDAGWRTGDKEHGAGHSSDA
ncbi:putative bifunctional diguanylate cyclase/phosphodiesterase [Microvirga sp. 2TAF3]|uniref:putative bifunctional diguanylate cyclase/phosphodiesterase n=1 Tax=Microvirga sp. 2TAF3 TaxID=3233014 RepID=UPI003F9CBC3F